MPDTKLTPRPVGAAFESLPPRAGKPVVFYGTSITHRACASRPGMVHTAILGRRLEVPVINIGFSGNGKMDAAVGDLLARLDAAVFVIDCLPSMQPDLVRARTFPLVKQLRVAFETLQKRGGRVCITFPATRSTAPTARGRRMPPTRATWRSCARRASSSRC